MVLYDKLNNKINAGDILRFDNDMLYVVFYHNNNYVIQNIIKYTPSLRLDVFVRNNIVPAFRVSNINYLN